MKNLLVLSIIIFCCMDVSAKTEDKVFGSIADEISSLRPKLKKGNVAVIPFEAVGFADSSYGTFSADKISAAISARGKLTLVEREKLAGIMKEKELSMIGLVEQDEAKKIGSLLAVEAIISGRVYRTEKGADLTVKVIDSQTGKVISVISRKYAFSSKISGKKPQSGFIGTWKVITTAPYLLEKEMKYEKLVLRDDDTFSLFLVNNDGRDVEIRGAYRINGNHIDYQPQHMLFDGKTTSFTKLRIKPEGTIYLEKGNLYFNYSGAADSTRTRLDAMNVQYRCVAVRDK